MNESKTLKIMRDEKITLVLESFLASMGHEIERVEWNKRQEQFAAPIHNAGTCYKTDEFVMRSYCWDDDSPLFELPNFQCDDFQAEWYKYYTRSLQCCEISINQLSDIFSRCWHSVEKSGRECNRDGTDFDSYNTEVRNELNISQGYESGEIGWEYEDELSSELGKSDYDKMFPFSRVISGVRMFPFVNIWEDSYRNAIRAYLPFPLTKTL